MKKLHANASIVNNTNHFFRIAIQSQPKGFKEHPPAQPGNPPHFLEHVLTSYRDCTVSAYRTHLLRTRKGPWDHHCSN